ncbi:MAG: pyridoxal-phosphate dependent enzyme [Acidimicrobiales bacterium]
MQTVDEFDTIESSHISAAADRIGPHLGDTPLVVSSPLTERTGATVAIKPEHQQLTGSFKLRGALNRVLTLSPQERENGVVTASSGNHGIAVATAAELTTCQATVYLPAGASLAKVAEIRRRGAAIVTVDSADAAEAERVGRAAAEREGFAYISPYNDPMVVAGQGTIGKEILDEAAGLDLRPIDAVVVAVGGGGLISGIGTWLANAAPEIEVIGASPANDAAMIASVAAGEIVDPETEPTYSDGTAGGIEAGALTFPLCRDLVDEWVTVPEEAIAGAVAAMIDDHHQLVEGAAGVAIAAATSYAERHPGCTVVAVSCGANVSSATLGRMLADV